MAAPNYIGPRPLSCPAEPQAIPSFKLFKRYRKPLKKSTKCLS